MLKLGLEKVEEPEINLPTFVGSLKKQKSSKKTSISALLTGPKPLTVWITTNCEKFKSEVTQSCLPLCDPVDCSLQASPSMGFSRQEYQGRLPFSSPEDLPEPGIEARSPTLQADILPSEPLGKPKEMRISEWVAFPFSRGSSQPRDRSQVSHIAGRCFNLGTTREALCKD